MSSRLFSAIFAFLFCVNALAETELSGRFSMLAAMAKSDSDTIINADQQGLRLMLDGTGGEGEWSAHLRTVRLHTDGISAATAHSSALFRYDELAREHHNSSTGNTTTRVRSELDRLYYSHRFENTTLTAGRQPVEWGSGRFWQPLNLFGAFAPTDLDTDYKPGIDAVNLEHYPSHLSSLSGVYAFGPRDSDTIEDSAAIQYRRQLGEQSELSLVGGNISGNQAIGGSYESVWGDVAWRAEGLYYELQGEDKSSLFWIAGIDYQFDDGTVLSAELYDNSRGASTEQELVGSYNDSLISSGLQQQLSRRLIGIGLSRDISPLLRGSYTLLAGHLEQGWSQLHQLNLTYSVSNESDLLMSLLLPSGSGLSASDEPQSEFGHLPRALTLRLRFYF